MAIPTALIAIPAVASALAAMFGSQKQTEQTEDQMALQQQQLAQNQTLTREGARVDESKLDPFRHILAQQSALQGLDFAAGADFKPSTYTLPQRYAQYTPKKTGGLTYSKSPELIAALQALKSQVMTGQGAPSNVGGTPTEFGTLDLNALMSGAAQPGTPGALASSTLAKNPTAARIARWYKQAEPEREAPGYLV